ncbi:hypothetical protein P280DRAFT_195749 [Massarina eburnea CBS 473.64]|uniref:Uncharacterized protein n=1 Tax=Massarina eburnea CBS 473.64 TaxID=1395130 RepID=A0A6A6RMF3_9PLEO|nr:hypothetical protein P280DRAFT_195749 [Massarina eburnea CBS 473.64]
MVYITSGLFGSDGTCNDRPLSPISMHSDGLNDMSESQFGNKKRKKGVEDVDGTSSRYDSNRGFLSNMDINLAASSKLQFRTSPTSRGVFNRSQGHDPASASNNHKMYPVSVAGHHATSDRRPMKQMKRTNPKLEKHPSHLMEIETELTPSSSERPQPSYAHLNLRSCHVCSTAPKRKRELEEYMDCRRCEGRTCYICARQCFRCGKAICKKCTVEAGEEGDSWCLECFSQVGP